MRHLLIVTPVLLGACSSTSTVECEPNGVGGYDAFCSTDVVADASGVRRAYVPACDNYELGCGGGSGFAYCNDDGEATCERTTGGTPRCVLIPCDGELHSE